MGNLGAAAALLPLREDLFAFAQPGDPVVTGDTDGDGLRVHAARKGIIYGAATVKKLFEQNPAYAAAFVRECAILVPDWEAKWKALRPTPTTYDFSAVDWLLQFATSHGLLFRGHTLVWHDALPDWFSTTVTPSNARQFLVDHIRTVVGRYAGKVHSWDVVNEAVLPTDGQPDGLRNSPWLRLLGPEYIELAFREAAKADPKALLVYNETHIEHDTPETDAKREAVLQLLRRLKQKGVPVQALGIQAHLSANLPFSKQKFQSFMSEASGMGLKLLITEMDVNAYNIQGSEDYRKQIVADMYATFLSAALPNRSLIAVLDWELSDRYSWLGPRKDHQPIHPLPLDGNMNRNPAWYAIAKAFDQAPGR